MAEDSTPKGADSIQHGSSPDLDKREVYKNPMVVETYNRRLYYGLSRGLCLKREMALSQGMFPERGIVLDCPCGTGKLAWTMKDKPGLILVGGDISPLMVAKSKETGLYHAVGVIDLTKTPFPDQFFDVVFVSRCFMLFPSLDDFFVELRRVIKPNGLLIFDSIRRSIHNLIHRTVGTHEGWNYPRSTEAILEICNKFGFECLERESVFLLSTGLMNRLPRFLFSMLSAMERFTPERWRVFEVYKTRKV